MLTYHLQPFAKKTLNKSYGYFRRLFQQHQSDAIVILLSIHGYSCYLKYYWYEQIELENIRNKKRNPIINTYYIIFISIIGASQFPRRADISPAYWMTADKPTKISRIKLKKINQKPVPMVSDHSAHSTPLPVGFRTWLWRYTCLLLLITMLWHRQAFFEPKGGKVSSAAECRIGAQGLHHIHTYAHTYRLYRWLSAVLHFRLSCLSFLLNEKKYSHQDHIVSIRIHKTFLSQ